MSLLLLFATQAEAPPGPTPPPVVADDHVGMTSRDLGVWQAFIRREPPDQRTQLSGTSTGAHFATLRLVPRASIEGEASSHHGARIDCAAHAPVFGESFSGSESATCMLEPRTALHEQRRIDSNNAALLLSFLSRKTRSK